VDWTHFSYTPSGLSFAENIANICIAVQSFFFPCITLDSYTYFSRLSRFSKQKLFGKKENRRPRMHSTGAARPAALYFMQQLQLQFHLKSHKIEAATGYLQIVNWQFCQIAELDNILKYLHISFCTFR